MSTYVKQRKVKGLFYYWNEKQGRWDTNLKHARPVVNQVINREVYFEDYTVASDPVPAVCKKFTCGRHLTLREQLAGSICIHCSDTKKVDVMKVLKFK